LSNYDADVLTAERALADYFETVAKVSGEPKLAANWVMGEVSSYLNKNEISISEFAKTMRANDLAAIIARIVKGTLSGKQAKDLFAAYMEEQDDIDKLIEKRGLKQVSDTGAIEKIVSDIVDANPDQTAQYRAADEGKRKKLLGFFVGQIMKASKGQANPGLVNEILLKKLQ